MSWEAGCPRSRSLTPDLAFAPVFFEDVDLAADLRLDGFFINASPQDLRIELPHRIVECRGEADPQQIRNEQRACDWSDAPEREQGCDDQRPQQQDVGEGQVTTMPGEE